MFRNRPYFYILVDGIPVPESDYRKWGNWYSDFENNCRIAKVEANGICVSTIFLGVDHAHFDGEPVLFETMIFGGEHDLYQERYHTLEEAMLGHERAVKLAGIEIPDQI